MNKLSNYYQKLWACNRDSLHFEEAFLFSPRQHTRKMSEWNDFVGNLAVCFSATLYLSGSQICLKIYKNGITGDISNLPFLTAFLNTYLAFVYGVLVDNPKIMIVNSIGFILESIYILIYFYFTPNKKKMTHVIGLLLITILGITAYTFVYEEMSHRAFLFIGYMGSFIAIVMFGSPLSSISYVFKSRSTESLSFPLCFANFATASLWSLYGTLINDYFVMLPNLVGSLLGFTQVALFAKFPDQSVSTRMKLKNEDSVQYNRIIWKILFRRFLPDMKISEVSSI